MVRIAVRNRSVTTPVSLVGTMGLGLALGALAGFVVGELAGPAGGYAIRRRARRPVDRPRAATLVAGGQAALDGDLILRDCRLRVLAAGPGRIELHGWVTDRQLRARAGHLVRDAVPADAIVNCVLVHGEDDLVGPTDDGSDQRLA